ncbi:MAG TPA: tagatose-6-phosphate ketose isomerase [Terriglobia bacterium]|nr:tagatose-6-phosphate ketose isomerase [Terriglobia bacterium]
MHNEISGLSSQAIESWLADLSAQVPEFAKLRTQLKHTGTAGYYHTLREICQQPLTWLDTSARVVASLGRLRAIVAESGLAAKRGALIFTGSGSSFYAGECLGLTLQRELAVPVEAIPAGLILTHPETALPPGQDCLVASLARSGDSPESTAVVDLLDEVYPGVRHLIITCNRNGRLAAARRDDPASAILVLDDATCDRSLVMTSSFSNLIWASRSLGLLQSPSLYQEKTNAVANAGRQLLSRNSEEIAALGRQTFRSVLYLGSGVRLGSARESALKMLEMTAGQVMTFAETYLGVRHGPLAAVQSDTLIICFLSSEPLVRAYELDLIRELTRKNLGMQKVIVGEQVPLDIGQPQDHVIDYGTGAGIGDATLPMLDVLVGQLLAFFRCLSLGLRPDTPSREDIINRVVGHFAIHRRA